MALQVLQDLKMIYGDTFKHYDLVNINEAQYNLSKDNIPKWKITSDWNRNLILTNKIIYPVGKVINDVIAYKHPRSQDRKDKRYVGCLFTDGSILLVALEYNEQYAKEGLFENSWGEIRKYMSDHKKNYCFVNMSADEVADVLNNENIFAHLQTIM
jgi:hypothetical protein